MTCPRTCPSTCLYARLCTGVYQTILVKCEEGMPNDFVHASSSGEQTKMINFAKWAKIGGP